MKPLFGLVLYSLCAVAHGADYPQPTGPALLQTAPYSLVGRLTFENGGAAFSGTGTVIRPRSVLTAAHVLYSFEGGWSTGLRFERARYGSTAASADSPSRLYVLGGYRSQLTRFSAVDARTFSGDLGAVVFDHAVAGGATAGWTTNTSLLTGKNFNIAFGYGGEFHSGHELLSVTPGGAFFRVTGAFYENRSLYFEPGMSGGPLFAEDDAGARWLAAVIVAGSSNPVAGGVRVLDLPAANFIRFLLP